MIPEVVAGAARRFGERPAFVGWDGSTITYTALHRRSDAMAAGLRRLGVGVGSVVCVTLPSDLRYPVVYAALAKLGAVTAGVNPRLVEPEQRKVIAATEPDLVLSVDVLNELSVASDIGDGGVPPLTPDPDRLVAVVFTSGSTGTPKGAVFRNRQLAAIDAIDAPGGRWGGGGPMLASTEFAHAGFMTKLAWYLRLGSTLHVMARWRAADALRLVSEHRMESIGGIATQFALMLRDPGFDRYDLSSVKTLIAGGTASPPELVREARERFGAAYSIRYSSTESGGIGTGTAFDADDEEALFTVGRPKPGIEVHIDGSGSGSGEVLLRSPTMMDGYWRDPVRTADVFVDGWLRTGDLGVIDDRGCLRLIGRADDMYVRGGYNVHPQEVEAALVDHPAVAAVTVVPRPDAVMGTVGVAVVVAAPGSGALSLAELRAFGASRLASYKLPEDLVVVDALPLTSSDKVDRRSLSSLVSRGETSH